MSDWLDSEVPALPVPTELPVEPSARLALASECWARLSDKQRVWLTAFRENRLNARETARQTNTDRRAHVRWMSERDYATIVRLWLGVTGSEALDKDRLLARQDDIVETLLTPKPVLHQGLPVFDPRRPGAGAILEEVDAGAASRANEVLMKAAGLFPKEGAEVNVGVAFTPVKVEVERPANVIDAVVEVVEAAPALPTDEDWLA